MLKKKYKLINTKRYDRYNLQYLLNYASENGWNLTGINRLLCKFERQDERKYYTVFPNYSRYSFKKYNELLDEQNELKDYLEEFGYISNLSTSEFEIYESTDSTEIYSDQEFEEKENWIKHKVVRNKIIFEGLMNLINVLLIFYLVFLTNNSAYMALAITFCCLHI